jgi:WD40 repeat protein
MVILHLGPIDKTIKVWNLSTRSFIFTLGNHSDTVTSLVQLENSDYLASGSTDKTIKIWDLNKRECIRTLTTNSQVLGLAILPNYDLISSQSDLNNALIVWDPITFQKKKIYTNFPKQIMGLLVLSNGNLVFGCENYIFIYG